MTAPFRPEFPVRFNLARYLLDHNLEAGRGGKVCLRYRDLEVTYAGMVELSDRAGNVLRELGVRMEDRVLLVLPDSPEFAAVWFGTLKIGAVFAMVNVAVPPEALLYYLDYSRAPVAVVAPEVAEGLRPHLPRCRYLRHLITAGGVVEGFQGLEELMAAAPADLTWADTTRDDVAGWLFTSGSTGHPKAAVHLHHDFAYNTECYAKRVLGIREDDVTAGVPKLYFGYATGTNLMFPFAVGAQTALFSERSTAERMFEIIERYRPTVLTSVPTMINAMLQVPDAARRDLGSLRMVLSAGEALPEELYNRWMDAFGVEILDGIGSAEMFHIYISNRPGDVVPGSLGKIVPGYEARIVGPDGLEVPDGEQGTLHIHGDSAAVGYWLDHEKSKATFAGDWCVTGDQFIRDERGNYFYAGRADDMIKVSGLFVSPLEIENLLLQHPAVRECCVVAAEDPDGLTKPKAFVVPHEGRKPGPQLVKALQQHVKDHAAPHKYPRWVEFLEALPRTDRGKVARRELQARAGGAPEGS
ncbi:MAG: benzoate-CoA ligase family protein [Acidobacteriota bacterium]|jgi:benzoate-CoA ligase